MKQTKLEQTTQTVYQPLAARLRPQRLHDYVGHATVVGTGTPLRQAIETGRAGSLILWGPPGVGKTTLAYLIAQHMQAQVERISAVAAGVRELRDVLTRAADRQRMGQRTVLIVDEIHRFNKAQQDVLLPAVEEGVVTLIGATTENPYFEVVKALLSRAEVVRLEPLTDQDIGDIIDRGVIELSTMQLSSHRSSRELNLAQDARALLIRLAGGDARRALNILERAASLGQKKITQEMIEAAAQQAAVMYDKGGDAHYDTISAFIKSLRGSDADAVLFYLFRMLVGGEDPKFIVRRMFIFASEDIGNADPHALMLVAAASQALEWVGLPEAEYTLAHAATYLAVAPKSNSVTIAMGRAKEDVAQHGNSMPPGHITNAPVAGMKKHGKGVGYLYPHDFPGHVVHQQYRADAVQRHVYYEPGDEGFEREVKRRVEAARRVLYGEA